MSRCPPARGTPFITRPRAKKKPRGPTEESRPKQNLLVYPRTPPHRQVDAILPAASSTLERASELIDAKGVWFLLLALLRRFLERMQENQQVRLHRECTPKSRKILMALD